MPDFAIHTENLTRKYGDFTAVDNITFNVKQGEIFGFLGANGAGKTTAMKMLTGLLSPTSGKARVSGKDVYTEAESIKKNIGYMSQRFSLYDDLTVQENIRFFGGIYKVSTVDLKKKNERGDRVHWFAGCEQKAGKIAAIGMEAETGFFYFHAAQSSYSIS